MAGLPDLVYVVGPGTSGHEELRYSLRSVAKNLPHRKVWIVGSCPEFIRLMPENSGDKAGAIALSLEPVDGKFENQRQSLTAAVNHPDVSDEFVLMNDDMFVVYQLDAPTAINPYIPCWHLGPISEYLAFLRSIGKDNDWVDALASTAEWLDGDPDCYEAHIPLLYHKDALRAVLSAFPNDRPFLAGAAYEAARAGVRGHQDVDSKVVNGDLDRVAHLPFLSSVDWAFKEGPIGQHIRQLFPEKCRYER